jgi:hypothetical protein
MSRSAPWTALSEEMWTIDVSSSESILIRQDQLIRHDCGSRDAECRFLGVGMVLCSPGANMHEPCCIAPARAGRHRGGTRLRCRMLERQRDPELMDDPNVPSREHRRALAGLAHINALSRASASVWHGCPESAWTTLLSAARGGGRIDIAAGHCIRVRGCGTRRCSPRTGRGISNASPRQRCKQRGARRCRRARRKSSDANRVAPPWTFRAHALPFVDHEIERSPCVRSSCTT